MHVLSPIKKQVCVIVSSLSYKSRVNTCIMISMILVLHAHVFSSQDVAAHLASPAMASKPEFGRFTPTPTTACACTPLQHNLNRSLLRLNKKSILLLVRRRKCCRIHGSSQGLQNILRVSEVVSVKPVSKMLCPSSCDSAT